METTQTERMKRKQTLSGGLIFAGFMFLVMGAGYMFGYPDTGMYIGMGLGFLAMAMAWFINSNK